MTLIFSGFIALHVSVRDTFCQVCVHAYVFIVCSVFIVVKYTYHKIYHLTILKCSPLAFGAFTRLWNQQACLVLEHSHHPRKKPLPVSSHSISPHNFPQPQTTTNPLSVCIDLHILDVSYINTWDPVIRDPLCLALSLSIMFSRLIHEAEGVSTAFPSVAR